MVWWSESKSKRYKLLRDHPLHASKGNVVNTNRFIHKCKAKETDFYCMSLNFPGLRDNLSSETYMVMK